MFRMLERAGIHIERGSRGLAVGIQTATERVLIVVEGEWSLARHSSECASPEGVSADSGAPQVGASLKFGTLLIESNADAMQRRTLDLHAAPAASSLATCFELLRRELRVTPIDQRVVRGLCEVVIGLAERKSNLAVSAGDTAPARLDAVRDLCVRKALTLLASRLSERWTVERLARELGLSRAALARRFSAATGSSPLRYLAARRIAEAEHLLANSDLPLSEIARRVGYESEFAFNRAFKRLRGVAPGQFRRSLGAGGRPLLALAA